jgi:hypothetical protein
MITDKQKTNLSKKDVKGLEIEYINACVDNNKELVEYILFSKDLKNNPLPECKNYQGLRNGANKGSFDVIKFLLEDERINKTKEFCEARKQVLIRNACHSGNIDLVKYLLEDEKTKKYINFSVNKYKPFEESLYSSNSDLVTYLFDKFKNDLVKTNYLNVFFRRLYKEKNFKLMCEIIKHNNISEYFHKSNQTENLTELLNQNKKEEINFIFTYFLSKEKAIEAIDYGSVMVAMTKVNLDILTMIIVDFNIPLTETLKEFIETRNDTENMKKIFSNRELNQKLNTNLNVKDKNKNKKHKI